MSNKLRVTMTLVMDVDTDAWTLDYGIDTRPEICEDVQQYVRNMIQDGPAGFENIELLDAE